jgi:hypothetical protein
MTDLDAEIVRKGLIEAFELIRELDEKPEMLKKLPKKSLWVDSGKKRMFIPINDKSKIVVI